MRLDAKRRDAYDGYDQTVPSSEKFAGERLQSEVWPVGAAKSFRAVKGARGGKRQTSKFHMARRVCVTSFHLTPETYSLTRESTRVHVKFLLDLLMCVRLKSLSKATISFGRFVRVFVLNL